MDYIAHYNLISKLWNQNIRPVYAGRILPTLAEQESQLRDIGLGYVLDLEFACYPSFASMEARGVFTNVMGLQREIQKAQQTFFMADTVLRSVLSQYGAHWGNPLSEDQCIKLLHRFRFRVRDLRSRSLREYDHRITTALADYRDAAKDVSILQRMAQYADRGILRGRFNQLGTVTARLVVIDFPLLNIPKKYRGLIILADGWIFIVVDFAAMDMRVLGADSGDKLLIEHLTNGLDFYLNAAAAFDEEDIDDVTGERRDIMKTIVLAVSYGKTPFTLKDDLDCNYGEAREAIEDFKRMYPKAEVYLQAHAERALKSRVSISPSGRRRYYEPDLRKDVLMRRARNFVIQSRASDIHKERLVHLDRMLLERGWGRVALAVHDSYVCQVREENAQDALAAIPQLLERSPWLSVPLHLKIGMGRTWAEAEAECKR